MDAPPPQEDVRSPFVRIGRHLIELGLSAPAIHAVDEDNGFLLLEDLGDDTFARVLAAGGEEAELYQPAPPTCWSCCIGPARARCCRGSTPMPAKR